jgi:azurin
MKILYITAILGLSILFHSCSNSTDETESGTETFLNTKEEKVEVEEPKDVRVLVYAPANDMNNIAFEPSEIVAFEGKKLTVVFENNSTNPTMYHNLLITYAGKEQEIYSNAIKATNANDFIPTDKTNIIANTRMLKIGEKDSFTIDVPTKGSYPFVCTYPGHLQMKGTLIVK